ncbi:uncharacterized protein LOC144109617 [Amblyomma americanum]
MFLRVSKMALGLTLLWAVLCLLDGAQARSIRKVPVRTGRGGPDEGDDDDYNGQHQEKKRPPGSLLFQTEFWCIPFNLRWTCYTGVIECDCGGTYDPYCPKKCLHVNCKKCTPGPSPPSPITPYTRNTKKTGRPPNITRPGPTKRPSEKTETPAKQAPTRRKKPAHSTTSASAPKIHEGHRTRPATSKGVRPTLPPTTETPHGTSTQTPETQTPKTPGTETPETRSTEQPTPGTTESTSEGPVTGTPETRSTSTPGSETPGTETISERPSTPSHETPEGSTGILF